MIKIRITYTTVEERENTLKILRRSFDIVKVSKEYKAKKPSKYASIYLDLKLYRK